ncbi:hypothetical protein IFR05_000513 [Cadophora sp. M221]|nr:hypothetical protein IFR05_000513 [Cadophora sp. M221]
MATLGLLQTASRIFHGGLEPYNYELYDASASENNEGDLDSTDGSHDGTEGEEDLDNKSVYSSAGSDPGAFRRNRAFAEFEARTFFYNMARRGREEEPSETYRGPVDDLKTCLTRQLGSDLNPAIEHVVVTGQSPRFNPNSNDLSDYVRASTALNTTLEGASGAVLSEAPKITVSQTTDGDFDPGSDDLDEVRQSLTDLYRHLQEGTSGCTHEVMLQTTGFKEANVHSNNRTAQKRFKLLLSPCQQSIPISSSLNSGHDDDANDEEDEEEEEQDIFVCRAITTYQHYTPQILHFSFNSLKLIFGDMEEDPSFPFANTKITLRELLDSHAFSAGHGANTDVYSWRDKYLLGFNLARSLFYLFNGPWGSSSWKTDEIFFLCSLGQDSDLGTVYNCHIPFVRCSLSTATDGSLDSKTKTSDRFRYPMWLALAQILVEIQIGRSLPVLGGVPPSNSKLQQALQKVVKDELNDNEYDMYREAIEACLNFGLKVLRIKGETRKKKAERKLIWNDIVRKLEKNYERWSTAASERVDLNFRLERQSQTVSETVEPKLETKRKPSPPASICQLPASSIQLIQKQSVQLSSRLSPGTSFLTLFDDENSNDNHCDKFFGKVDLFNAQYINPMKAIHKSIKCDKIRIAVLDSGVDSKNDKLICGAFKNKRISDSGWSRTGTTKEHFHDTYGHGTHVVRLLLKTAPLAEIHIAKITEGKNLDEGRVQDIVDAITWAVKIVDAHIITMSFGMEKEAKEVTEAIKMARVEKKLVFAAAANEGGLQPRAHPASVPGVICIHAADGFGDPASFNPTADEGDDNFSTAGVGIESKWKGNPVFKSGTSFATPVAAGIAASILDFARTHLMKEHDTPDFFGSYVGMRLLLKSMAPKRQSYRFILPWNVFRKMDNPGSSELQSGWERVCEELRNFILTGEAPKEWRSDK